MAARIAENEAQNAAYREAKIRRAEAEEAAGPAAAGASASAANVAAWTLTQVELVLDVDLGRRELGGAAMLTVAPTPGAQSGAMGVLVLDVRELDVRRVGLPSEGLDELPFAVSPAAAAAGGEALTIELPPPEPGWGWATLVVRVEYAAKGGPGLRWLGGVGDGAAAGGSAPPFLFAGGAGQGAAPSIFPCMDIPAVAVTHSAVVRVTAPPPSPSPPGGAAVAAAPLNAFMCAADDTALLQTLLQRGLVAEEGVEPEPEPESGAKVAASRSFTLRVSSPIPSSELTLAIGLGSTEFADQIAGQIAVEAVPTPEAAAEVAEVVEPAEPAAAACE